MLNLDEDLYRLGEEVIGNLDEDGYLKRDLNEILKELSMFEHIDISLNEAEKLLKKMQKFDPVGVASRNLQECLLVQINQISPDFIIEKLDDSFVITLNDKSLPSVTISRTYLEMFKNNKKNKKNPRDKSTYKFLREKFESAKWFIACIQQRRDTLMRIMQAIVEKQYEFFDKGPKFLRPMIYKDIAEEIQMDISTISRVVNGKYVQSPMGIHELKYFFSEGLITDSGEEVSNKHIKERLKELMESEDKSAPYSDDRLAEILNEEGIHIARRTVAKYREQLRLP